VLGRHGLLNRKASEVAFFQRVADGVVAFRNRSGGRVDRAESLVEASPFRPATERRAAIETGRVVTGASSGRRSPDDAKVI